MRWIGERSDLKPFVSVTLLDYSFNKLAQPWYPMGLSHFGHGLSYSPMKSNVMSVLYELQGVEGTIREIDGIVSLDSSTALENLLSVWLQVKS